MSTPPRAVNVFRPETENFSCGNAPPVVWKLYNGFPWNSLSPYGFWSFKCSECHVCKATFTLFASKKAQNSSLKAVAAPLKGCLRRCKRPSSALQKAAFCIVKSGKRHSRKPLRAVTFCKWGICINAQFPHVFRPNALPFSAGSLPGASNARGFRKLEMRKCYIRIHPS